jgi:hypothetical protein
MMGKNGQVGICRVCLQKSPDLFRRYRKGIQKQPGVDSLVSAAERLAIPIKTRGCRIQG